MDTVYVTDSVVLPSAKMHKSVEEMSINGEEPPQEYFVKDSSFGSMESSDPSLGSIPIIDINIFSLSSSHDPKEVENEIEKLRSALSSGGCFQAIGHGIPSSLLDKLRQVAKQFFALPAEEKHKYSRAANEVEGYGQDRVVSEKQILDWSSRLSLKVFPEGQRRLNFWPENPSDFKDILHEYVVKLKGVMDILFKAMEKSLNLVEGSFSSQFGDNSLIKARFNFYPPCSRPDMVLGVKAHSDRSGTTVLLQDDEVGGLQIFKDDEWINVPVIHHALVVNLGDQMQIMSNGIFKSPLHRVLTNTDKLRISVATFNEPEPDKEIGPVEQLIDEERPRLYRNVKNFAAFNYECFQKGKPPSPRPDLVLGLKPHADGSAITFVLQDKEVEGFQFLKDNQWIRVPAIPQALVINRGDQAEIMSNGIFKSPVHRVVTNSERERISVAVFSSPDSDKEIEPIGRLFNDSRPRLYKKVKNYVDTYFQYYQQGKRPIDAVRY
ncbi:hypothetical protein CMV_005290 [Castanea mollissima]|uniref:Fe2OG dioxygenase domain-containing protein n=1 Tax=Castanea mollissima TaxID=60419 RepID=A0A8J4VSH9_9ROSI|nr:hypothetical protein CMV_005290 [Castanea mollissima]